MAAKKKPAAKKLAAKKPAAKKPAAKVTRSQPRAAGAVTTAPATDEALPPGMPRPGQVAPDFTVVDENEQPVRLAALRGQRVVLYFYPRDKTPGCTLEAQEFSSLLPEFTAKNAIVLGVSTDGAASHRKFRLSCGLSVRLLADTGRAAHEAYGTWREKNMYGKRVMGTQRATFLIDEQGRVARVWPKVKVENHALDVLNALDALGG
jgi:peroxiredoxin Q/BCP